MTAKTNELVIQIETALRAATNAEMALLTGLRSVCLACRIPYGEIWTRYSERPNLYLMEYWHPPNLDFTDFLAVSRRYAFAPGVGLPGRVWQSLRAEIIKDLRGRHDFSRREIALAAGFRTAVAFPITRGNDPFAVLVFLMFERDAGLFEIIGRLTEPVSREITERWAHRMGADVYPIAHRSSPSAGHGTCAVRS